MMLLVVGPGWLAASASGVAPRAATASAATTSSLDILLLSIVFVLSSCSESTDVDAATSVCFAGARRQRGRAARSLAANRLIATATFLRRPREAARLSASRSDE